MTRLTVEQALRAIKARIEGIWTDPDLMEIGPLSTDPLEDIELIIALTKEN